MVSRMRLIVDTWNVLHVQGVLPSGLAGLDLIGLSRLIGRSRWNEVPTDLICDGRPPRAPEALPGHISVSWSGHEQEADDLIEAIIEGSSSPRRLTVVSSDLRLRKSAKRRRCTWLDAPTFLRTLLEDLSTSLPDQAPKATEGTVAQWTKTFGLNPEAIEQLHQEAASTPLPDTTSPQDRPTPPANKQSMETETSSQPQTDLDPLFPAHLIEQAMRIAKGEH